MDVSRPMNLLEGAALVLWASLAGAQSNLGELLDAGGQMLSPEEFKRELVQRVVVGPTPTGGTLEVMYATNGSVVGKGSTLGNVATQRFRDDSPIAGEWKIDDNGRVCSTLRVGASTPGTLFILAPR